MIKSSFSKALPLKSPAVFKSPPWKRGSGAPRVSVRSILVVGLALLCALYAAAMITLKSRRAREHPHGQGSFHGVQQPPPLQHGSALVRSAATAGSGGGGGTGSGKLRAALPQHVGVYSLAAPDSSPRCKASGICDGVHECGDDGMGCITDPEARRNRVRDAGRWSWKAYRC